MGIACEIFEERAEWLISIRRWSVPLWSRALCVEYFSADAALGYKISSSAAQRHIKCSSPRLLLSNKSGETTTGTRAIEQCKLMHEPKYVFFICAPPYQCDGIEKYASACAHTQVCTYWVCGSRFHAARPRSESLSLSVVAQMHSRMAAQPPRWVQYETAGRRKLQLMMIWILLLVSGINYENFKLLFVIMPLIYWA